MANWFSNDVEWFHVSSREGNWKGIYIPAYSRAEALRQAIPLALQQGLSNFRLDCVTLTSTGSGFSEGLSKASWRKIDKGEAVSYRCHQLDGDPSTAASDSQDRRVKARLHEPTPEAVLDAPPDTEVDYGDSSASGSHEGEQYLR